MPFKSIDRFILGSDVLYTKFRVTYSIPYNYSRFELSLFGYSYQNLSLLPFIMEILKLQRGFKKNNNHCLKMKWRFVGIVSDANNFIQIP